MKVVYWFSHGSRDNSERHINELLGQFMPSFPALLYLLVTFLCNLNRLKLFKSAWTVGLLILNIYS